MSKMRKDDFVDKFVRKAAETESDVMRSPREKCGICHDNLALIVSNGLTADEICKHTRLELEYVIFEA